MNEIIKTVLNFLLFFTKRFYQKAQKRNQAKVLNANKRPKIKNVLRNI